MTKITPADYPDLLAAVEEGVTQRELARRYDCAPSLVARHIARAKRNQDDLGDQVQESDLVGPAVDPHPGSMREVLEARIHDPRTSARDLAALINALAKLDEEQRPAELPSVFAYRTGTLIVEPEARGPETTWRIRLRGKGTVEDVMDGLQPEQAWSLIACYLMPAVGREALGLDT